MSLFGSDKLKGKRVAIIATDGFEQVELTKPQQFLKDAGAHVDVVSINGGTIKGWDVDDWGDKVDVDKTIDQVQVADYDALVLPGGQINPDKLRLNHQVVSFVRDFAHTGKPVAAICHGPWTLIEAGRGARQAHDQLAQPPNRPAQRRGRLAGLGGGGGWQLHHQPQARRQSPPSTRKSKNCC